MRLKSRLKQKFNRSRGLVALVVVLLVGVAANSVSAPATETPAKAKETPTVAKETPTKKKKATVRENVYYYSAFSKRDPFASLIGGDFVSEKKMSPIELSRVELVGVVKGEFDRFALLEDNKGFSYIMRVGDKVRNGSVVAIGERSMVARVTNFGQTSKVTLRLAKKEQGDRK